MNRICKLIHTDLKPENVVICLTKDELREIRDKGVLKTTKMYHQDENQIARAIAGAHENIILSHREFNQDEEIPSRKQTEGTQSELEISKVSSQHNSKNSKKKQQYKKKQKQVKKFIKQGKLPANYSQLPKEEKDRLYNEVCPQAQQSKEKEADNNNLPSKVEEDDKADETIDINIEPESIDINVSTQMTTNTDFNKTNADFKESTDLSTIDLKPKEEVKKEAKPSKVKSPAKCRPSSVPHKADGNEDEEREIEKLKQLMGDGMEDTPTKPNIPKLNTDILKYQAKMNDKATKRGPKIDENVNVAIVDMGNG